VAHLLSVNLGIPRANTGSDMGVSAIDRRPSAEPVVLRAPGPKHGGLGSGLLGDHVCDRRHHGGDDQAVYAYAREDLDLWAAELPDPGYGAGRGVRAASAGVSSATPALCSGT
jgi:MOSC domain-containing protein YiiM